MDINKLTKNIKLMLNNRNYMTFKDENEEYFRTTNSEIGVVFIKDKKKSTTKQLTNTIKALGHPLTIFIICIGDKLDAKLLDYDNNENVQVFNWKSFMFNILENKYVPKFEKTNTELNIDEIPVILSSDVMARYYNMKHNEVYKIIRNTGYASYRVCKKYQRNNVETKVDNNIKIEKKNEKTIEKKVEMNKTFNPRDFVEIIKFYSKSKDEVLPKLEKGKSWDIWNSLPDWRKKLPEWRKILSNFHSIDITMEGKVYPSIEHYFQAAKALHSNKPELAILFEKGNKIGNQLPVEAKKAGSRKFYENNGMFLDTEKWNKNSEKIMYDALMARSLVDEKFNDILKNSYEENYYLLHFERSGKKSEWGGAIEEETGNIVGKNRLGILLMILREELVSNSFHISKEVKNLNTTQVVNVKTKYISPKYKDIKEWMEDPQNVYVARAGVVFIKKEDGSKDHAPIQSIGLFEAKLGKSHTLYRIPIKLPNDKSAFTQKN